MLSDQQLLYCNELLYYPIGFFYIVYTVDLCEAGDREVVDADMGRQRGAVPCHIGYVFGLQGINAGIHTFSPVLIALEAHEGEFGFCHPGVYGGNLYAIAQQVYAGGLGKGIDRILGGAVYVAILIYLLTGRRAYVDDMATCLLAHHRGYLAGHIEQALEVGVYHCFPVIQVALIYSGKARCQACIVYEYVYPVYQGLEVIYGYLHLSAVAHIEVECDDPDAISGFQLGLYFGQSVGAAAGNAYGIAFFGKAVGNGLTESGCSACDEYGLI